MTQPPDLLGAPIPAVPPRRVWLAAVLVVVVAAGLALVLRRGENPQLDALGSVLPSTTPASTPPPLPSPTPSPTLSPSPAATLTPTPGPTREPRAVAVSRSPQPTDVPVSEKDEHARYCRSATRTTGPLTVELEVCAWPGAANDAYTVTTTLARDLVYRGVVVDHGDGTSREQPHEWWKCSDTKRPRTLYDGESIHEWPLGRHTVTATVTAHRCGIPGPSPTSSPDPGYEDDQPVTAVVTLDLLKA